MATTTTTTPEKRERDKRTDVLLKLPDELCLFGGLTLLDPIEQGPLDTLDDPSSPFHDPRLRLPLDSAHVAQNCCRDCGDDQARNFCRECGAECASACVLHPSAGVRATRKATR